MKRTRRIAVAAGAFALFGMVAASGPAVLAQDATPAADAQASDAAHVHPVHIHTGNCNNLGEVVAPLTDLVTPEGDGVGQNNRATPAYTSYTSVPMTLEAILGSNHSINAHLSAEEIGTYIACGEIGGVLTPEGQLAIGLLDVEGSGYSGVAFLSPGADGASTDVSVFLISTGGDDNGAVGGGEEAIAAEDDAAVTDGEDVTITDDSGDAAADDMTEMEEMEGMEGMESTPAP